MVTVRVRVRVPVEVYGVRKLLEEAHLRGSISFISTTLIKYSSLVRHAPFPSNCGRERYLEQDGQGRRGVFRR
jgi:hypothetical protein